MSLCIACAIVCCLPFAVVFVIGLVKHWVMPHSRRGGERSIERNLQ